MILSWLSLLLSHSVVTACRTAADCGPNEYCEQLGLNWFNCMDNEFKNNPGSHPATGDPRETTPNPDTVGSPCGPCAYFEICVNQGSGIGYRCQDKLFGGVNTPAPPSPPPSKTTEKPSEPSPNPPSNPAPTSGPSNPAPSGGNGGQTTGGGSGTGGQNPGNGNGQTTGNGGQTTGNGSGTVGQTGTQTTGTNNAGPINGNTQSTSPNTNSNNGQAGTTGNGQVQSGNGQVQSGNSGTQNGGKTSSTPIINDANKSAAKPDAGILWFYVYGAVVAVAIVTIVLLRRRSRRNRSNPRLNSSFNQNGGFEPQFNPSFDSVRPFDLTPSQSKSSNQFYNSTGFPQYNPSFEPSQFGYPSEPDSFNQDVTHSYLQSQQMYQQPESSYQSSDLFSTQSPSSFQRSQTIYPPTQPHYAPVGSSSSAGPSRQTDESVDTKDVTDYLDAPPAYELPAKHLQC